MSGVRVEDQLSVWSILEKNRRVGGIKNDVRLSIYHQNRLLDVLQISEALTNWISPLLQGGKLGRSDLFVW